MRRIHRNLGWCPNDKKSKELWTNVDRAADGVPMMRNQINKEYIEIEPMLASQRWETKCTKKEFR